MSLVVWAWPAMASVSTKQTIDTPQVYLQKLAGKDYILLNRIILCESGWKSNIKNPNSSASGLFQFLASTWSKWGQGDVFDPYNNIDAGIDLFRAEGTKPWEASKDCWK